MARWAFDPPSCFGCWHTGGKRVELKLVFVVSHWPAITGPVSEFVCVCEIRHRMRNDFVCELFQQGVDAWSGSHPPAKTLPFQGDIDLGRWIDVPANLWISFNC